MGHLYDGMGPVQHFEQGAYLPIRIIQGYLHPLVANYHYLTRSCSLAESFEPWSYIIKHFVHFALHLLFLMTLNMPGYQQGCLVAPLFSLMTAN